LETGIKTKMTIICPHAVSQN